jgi:hypothetical protein
MSRATCFVSGLLKHVLAMDEKPLIDRAHRSLRPKPRDDDRPRDIILRVHSSSAQPSMAFSYEPAILLWAFKDRSSLSTRTTPPTVSRQRADFGQAKWLLRDLPGVKYGLRFPAFYGFLMMVTTTPLILRMRLWLTFNVPSRSLELAHRSATVACELWIVSK